MSWPVSARSYWLKLVPAVFAIAGVICLLTWAVTQ